MDVKLYWCPGHQGIKGNELAENLARKGLDQPVIIKDQFTSYSFLVERIKKKFHKPGTLIGPSKYLGKKRAGKPLALESFTELLQGFMYQFSKPRQLIFQNLVDRPRPPFSRQEKGLETPWLTSTI